MQFFRHCLFIVLLLGSCFSIESQEKNIPTYNYQDRPNLSADSPLKGLSQFLVFCMCPTASKEMSDEILNTVEKKLSLIGKVKRSKILIKTDKGEAIDLQPLDAAATLIYELRDVEDVNGKNLGIVRASLNLTTEVQINKTKQSCSPYVWSSNCFLKGTVKKNVQELVNQSLALLLDQFKVDFTKENTYSPTFDLQGAD